MAWNLRVKNCHLLRTFADFELDLVGFADLISIWVQNFIIILPLGEQAVNKWTEGGINSTVFFNSRCIYLLSQFPLITFEGHSWADDIHIGLVEGKLFFLKT